MLRHGTDFPYFLFFTVKTNCPIPLAAAVFLHLELHCSTLSPHSTDNTPHSILYIPETGAYQLRTSRLSFRDIGDNTSCKVEYAYAAPIIRNSSNCPYLSTVKYSHKALPPGRFHCKKSLSKLRFHSEIHHLQNACRYGELPIPSGVLQGSCRVSRVFTRLFSLPLAPALG